MHGLDRISPIVLLFVFSIAASTKAAIRRVDGGIYVPIRYRARKEIAKRGERTAVVGMGDFKDVTYGVVLTMGGKDIPLVLDTGSADLWVLSDGCASCAEGGPQLYPQAKLESSGLSVRLQYGDSRTGTFASGPIGQDEVALLDLSLPDQYFAAINETNTSVLDSGYSGIFGLGFPINSFIWHDIYVKTLDPMIYQEKRAPERSSRFSPHSTSPNHPSLSSRVAPRQITGSTATSAILQSLPSMGPLIPRLAMNDVLKEPMFTVALQRDAIDIGGNAGMLSIGELPHGVKLESLTWANVRGYTVAQKGLPPPSDSPQETYPMAWEILVDDVYFDGVKLQRSSLPKTNISVTALVDTGNSLIRGPADVVAGIFSRLGSSQFDCSTPHSLAFQISGKMFPVDPRDFISPVSNTSTEMCFANLVATDTPVEGENYLYSWSLGAPFLKGVIAAFHYGNITYPSRDPPRIGLLSTVSEDVDKSLKAAVASASRNGGGFPVLSEPPSPGPFVSTRPTPISVDQSATSTSVPGRPPHSPSEGFANSAPSADELKTWITLSLLSSLLGFFGLYLV